MQKFKKLTPLQKTEWIFAAGILLFDIIMLITLMIKQILTVKYAFVLFLSPVLCALCILFTSYTRQKSLRILGCIIGILAVLCMSAGMYLINKTNDIVTEISGQTQKTDAMVIAVRIDDPASNRTQIANYRIGRQTVAHKEATDKLLDELKPTNEPIKYDTIQAEANALLNQEIDAAIYSDNFTQVLKESIEGYESRIKILSTDTVTTDIQPQTTDVTKPFCFYISGIDQNGPVNQTGRSDVNIILAVNPQNKHILMVSTPRDYYVPIPSITGASKDKLTHAGIYGPDVSVQTLEQLYEIRIPYYAKLNFTSMVTLVDTIGGIDVSIPQTFTSGGYTFTQGTQHLNGKQALAFCRERKNFTDGDMERGRNQERVLSAILKRCMQPDVLLQAGTLMDILSKNVETNMPGEDIYKLIQMQLDDPSEWNIETRTANGTPSTQSCYSYGSTPLSVILPDETSIQTLKNQFQKQQNGDSL